MTGVRLRIFQLYKNYNVHVDIPIFKDNNLPSLDLVYRPILIRGIELRFLAYNNFIELETRET